MRLPTKGTRYNAHFYGMDSGHWRMMESVLWGAERREWDWWANSSLYSRNDWKNLSVEGATETHSGFRKALREMVRSYPELEDWIVVFDGPFHRVSDLLGKTQGTDWSGITFYHGTSSAALDNILGQGLKPRKETGAVPAYGAHVTRAAPSREDAVYLTTQMNTAQFAARDAARSTESEPVIIEIKGVDGRFVAPDEDSRESDPRKSLERLGSIAYVKTIPPALLKRVFWIDEREWQRLGSVQRVAFRWVCR